MFSIVTPVYNEEMSIRDTVETFHKTLKENGYDEYEIIVVNDGSTDNSKAIAEELDVTLISHPTNGGYGKALKTGISAAKYDTIVITDSDGTYPFEEFPNLYKKFEEGFDMVVGARMGSHYRESWIKYPLRRILKFLAEFTCSNTIDDVNSGFRVFKKSLVMENKRQLCDTFSFSTSLTLAAFMTGKFVAYLPIGYNERVGETKVRLVRDSMITLQYILQAVNYYNPLKLYILFFMLCVLCSIFGFAFSALFSLTSGFFLGVGGLLVSLLILSCGLMADLVRHIAHNTRGDGE